MNTDLLTESELAEWLRISKTTLHKLREAGQLPFQLIGNSIRYSRTDVECWLRENSFNNKNKENDNE